MKVEDSQQERVVKKKGLNLPIRYTPVYLSLGVLLLVIFLWHQKPAVLGAASTTTPKVCTLPLSFFGMHFCLF